MDGPDAYTRGLLDEDRMRGGMDMRGGGSGCGDIIDSPYRGRSGRGPVARLDRHEWELISRLNGRK